MSAPSAAMDFTAVPLPDGSRILLARGEIVTGDAERFATALQTVGRDRFGHKVVALDSAGGQVKEAFAMVAVMDKEKVATIVQPRATCLSACFQILFLSGAHRYVLDGGRLGLHACTARGQSGRNTLCNELIAQNAMAHGTDYGTIAAFLHLTGPSDVRFFDAQEADCWGFTRWPPGIERGAKAGELAPCIRSGPRAPPEPPRNPKDAR